MPHRHTICAAMARHADVCVLPVGRSDRPTGPRATITGFRVHSVDTTPLMCGLAMGRRPMAFADEFGSVSKLGGPEIVLFLKRVFTQALRYLAEQVSTSTLPHPPVSAYVRGNKPLAPRHLHIVPRPARPSPP
eukprot:scaffold4041_cov109-Isochrysis_galbana.AAC.1